MQNTMTKMRSAIRAERGSMNMGPKIVVANEVPGKRCGQMRYGAMVCKGGLCNEGGPCPLDSLADYILSRPDQHLCEVIPTKGKRRVYLAIEWSGQQDPSQAEQQFDDDEGNQADATAGPENGCDESEWRRKLALCMQRIWAVCRPQWFY